MLDKEKITERECEGVEWIHRDGGSVNIIINFGLHNDKEFGESCTTLVYQVGQWVYSV
jgi:hypothetical protein